MIQWTATEEIAQNITKRIVELCHPDRVVLFGSVARGEPRDYSDLDLLVVWGSESLSNSREKRINLRNQLGFLPVPLDLLTCTMAEFEMALKDPRSFTSQIMKEGKTLYERFN